MDQNPESDISLPVKFNYSVVTHSDLLHLTGWVTLPRIIIWPQVGDNRGQRDCEPPASPRGRGGNKFVKGITCGTHAVLKDTILSFFPNLVKDSTIFDVLSHAWGFS